MTENNTHSSNPTVGLAEQPIVDSSHGAVGPADGADQNKTAARQCSGDGPSQHAPYVCCVGLCCVALCCVWVLLGSDKTKPSQTATSESLPLSSAVERRPLNVGVENPTLASRSARPPALA